LDKLPAIVKLEADDFFAGLEDKEYLGRIPQNISIKPRILVQANPPFFDRKCYVYFYYNVNHCQLHYFCGLLR